MVGLNAAGKRSRRSTQDGSGQLLRLVYFTYFCGFGIYQPYLNLYFDRIGFTSAQIGAFAALRPLAAMIAPPVCGSLADASGQRARVLRAILWIGIPAYGLMLMSRSFGWLLTWGALFTLCAAPVIPLLDAAAGEAAASDYGRIRRWGSVGYMLAVVLIGQLSEDWPLPLLLSGAAAMAAIAGALTFPLGGARSGSPASSAPAGHPRAPRARRATLGAAAAGWRAVAGVPAAWRDVWRVAPLRPVFIAGCLASLAGVPHYTFFSIYADSLGMPEGWIGLSWGIGVLSEILVMSAAARWNARFGPRALFCLGLAGAVARWTGMAFAVHPAQLLTLQLLHGLTFGAFQVGAVMLIHGQIPTSLRTSAQALWAALGSGAAGILGAFLAGSLYDRIGPRPLFAAAAAVAGLALGCALLWRPKGAAPSRPRPSRRSARRAGPNAESSLAAGALTRRPHRGGR